MSHQRLAFVYSPRYCVDIGAHVFDTSKYRRIAERIAAEFGRPGEDILIAPEPASPSQLAAALEPDYLRDLIEARRTPRTRRSELPISREIVEAAFLCAGGTIRAAREALRRRGIGFHIGGGWHHAYPDHAEGFCYVNDLAVAALVLRAEGAARRAAVVDCDLHQGNGTAACFRADAAVFCFSIHQERLYPFPKERGDWDIGLANGAGDEEYLARLAEAVPRIYDEHRPDIVLYVAGADPCLQDQLGDLALTMDGLRRRDERVIFAAAERGIPLVVALAGGYAPDIADIVAIHLQTARVCAEAAAMYEAARE